MDQNKLNALGYAYVLRVPILLLLVMILLAAGPFGGAGENVLEGIFDVSYGNDTWWSFVRFFILSLATYSAALAIGLSAGIIALDGKARFGLPVLPHPSDEGRSSGIELLFRLIPLLVATFVIAAAVKQTESYWVWNLAGAALGFGLFLWLIPLALRATYNRLTGTNSGLTAWLIKNIPGDKKGYMEGRTISAHQRLAVLGFLFSLAIYIVLGLTKRLIYFGDRQRPSSQRWP